MPDIRRIMKYQEFIEHIKEYVSSQLDVSHKVIIQPVMKNNGTVYDGLIVIDPILNISPTIYLNPYYHRYLEGISLDDICDDILTAYHENLPEETFDISSFKDFEKAKPQIIMKLVNYERNKELLKDVPHVRFHDLAMIYVVAVCDFLNEFATILIHNHHLSFWDIKPEDLYPIATANTPVLLPYRFEPMEEMLEHMEENLPDFITELPMSILTNQIKIHGATCMVYPGLLKEISMRLDDDLIIIPSSIHEVLIIPASRVVDEYTMQDFSDMIAEVNETQLTDDEVLADHAYLYIKDDEHIIY